MDNLAAEWEASYKAQHPADWKRMRRKFKGKLGSLDEGGRPNGAHTNAQATIDKKLKHEVPMQGIKKDADISEDDEPVFLCDYEHVTELHPYLRRARELDSFNRGGAYIDPNEITRDEITPEGEKRLTARECEARGRALDKIVKKKGPAHQLRAIAHDEAECLAVLSPPRFRAVEPGPLIDAWAEGRKTIYVPSVPISEVEPSVADRLIDAILKRAA